MVLDLQPHLKCVALYYLEKSIFIHISQNNLLVRMINWEVFLINRFIFSLISIS